MKKCPYCAEDIQNEARFCRWCHKDLTETKFSIQRILRQTSFLLVFIAAFSFFLPFVRFQFPMMGSQSFSAAGVLMQLVKAPASGGQIKEDGRFSIDARSLQKMMASDDGKRVFKSKPVYLLIPIGLLCGALAYVLLIFIATGLWMKTIRAVSLVSACGALLTGPLMMSLFLLNDLVKTTIHSSIGQLRDNPFANLAGIFMQGIRIEPAIAVYLLGGATFLVAVINGIRPQESIKKNLCLLFMFVLLNPSLACGGVPMTLTSPDFTNNSRMPVHLTCQGEDVSPDLDIAMVPPKANSLILIVDDPDAPMGTWDHWIVYNIPPNTAHIASRTVPGVEGWNSFQRTAWGGPCPPSGTHRYFFKLYALDKSLDLGIKARKKDIEAAMAGHIMDQAELIGLYQKK